MAHNHTSSGSAAISQKDFSGVLLKSLENKCSGLTAPRVSEILPSGNSIVQCAILASLDNVIGPKALCIWKQNVQDLKNQKILSCAEEMKSPGSKTEQSPVNQDDTIKYIVVHTLQGELSKDATRPKNFRTEMFIVPHKNVVANAIVFGVEKPNKKDSIGHSFSIACRADIWQYFLKIQYLCNIWQQRMAANIQLLLSTGATSVVIEKVSSTLLDFCNMLCSLQLCGLSSFPMVSETHLSMRHILDRKLLERTIVSHVQTCGCSVVVGDNENSVNLMINTLAQFIQEKDLATCRHVMREKSWPYHSGLFIQGLLKDQFGEADILAQDVLHSHFPVTIIDIPQNTVRQSLNFYEHTILRHKALREELLNLMITFDSHQAATPTNSLFQSVLETGTLVPELLIELATLPPTESVLQRHIKDFYRKLEYKAITMLNHLEFLRSKNLPLSIRNIKKILGFDDDVDLQIILSVAERLRPGIYSYIVTRGKTPAAL